MAVHTCSKIEVIEDIRKDVEALNAFVHGNGAPGMKTDFAILKRDARSTRWLTMANTALLVSLFVFGPESALDLAALILRTLF